MERALDARGSWSVGLVVALSVSTLLVLVAFGVRIAFDVPGGAPLPQRLMAVLFAAAALCSAALTIRRAPSVSWLATAAAAGIAAEEIVVVSRTAQPVVATESWPLLVAISAAALTCGVGVAAAYAARRRVPAGRVTFARAVAAAMAIGVGASAGTGLWAIATAATETSATTLDADLWPIRVAARLSLALIALGLLVGVVRDLAGPLGRVQARRRTDVPERAAASRSFLGDLADEMLPPRSIERRRAVEQERSRLAADIHALVLPELRQAASAANATGVPDDVAAGLRRSLDGIEQLMHERQSIVLEEFGLVAALEWLAERTEERSTLRVNLELDGDRIDDRRAVPADVGRLAFRVALLSLDNVVRHARATAAVIRLTVTADAISLSVTDDGVSFEAASVPGGGRGLVDMRTEAAAVGGALTVEGLGRGTSVEMTWPASKVAGYHTSPDRNLTARPDTLAR